MWTCSLCNRSFKNDNQHHYCGDKTVGDFLAGKTDVTLALFDQLMLKLEEIGPVQLHATKSMIVIAASTRFAYIIQLGKSFIDIVIPFKEAFDDNLCFKKIALVPGTDDYNHHLRLMYPADLNEEVLNYFKKAYRHGKAI